MQHELKQVEVRLKLTDKAGVFSMEGIDTPDKAVSVLAPVLAELDREWKNWRSGQKRCVSLEKHTTWILFHIPIDSLMP